MVISERLTKNLPTRLSKGSLRPAARARRQRDTAAQPDPRARCMACGTRPADVIIEVLARDGGWTWWCGHCYGRAPKRHAIIGTVHVGEPVDVSWKKEYASR